MSLERSKSQNFQAKLFARFYNIVHFNLFVSGFPPLLSNALHSNFLCSNEPLDVSICGYMAKHALNSRSHFSFEQMGTLHQI